MFLLCSYRSGSRCGAVRRGLEPRRSIFDIVYQTTPNGTDRRANPRASMDRPVNFLYMGLFLGFKKD
jgi:hypothetical protein